MPVAPPRNCDYPGGCLGYAQGGSQYCDKHQPRAVEWDRELDRARYKRDPWRSWYGHAQWKRNIKPACLARDPLCKLQITPLCKQHGGDGTKVAHHIKDHRGDRLLFFNLDNVQGVCRACHDALKHQEVQVAQTGSDSGAPQFITAANDAAVDRALADIADLGDVDLITIP